MTTSAASRPSPRSRIFAVLALVGAAGFALGWLARSTIKSTGNTPPVAEVVKIPSQPIIGRASTEAANVAMTPAAPKTPRLTPGIEALRRLRGAGVNISGAAFGFSGLDERLRNLLEIDTPTADKLTAAWREAQSAVNQLRARLAKPRMSDDGKTLWLDFPGIDPTESGRIYDKLISQISTTLSPDQYALFNEYVGDNFDRSLEGFGLTALRYEVSLQTRPNTTPPGAIIDYKRHLLDPSGASVSWSGNSLLAQDIPRFDPLLAPFIPPTLK